MSSFHGFHLARPRRPTPHLPFVPSACTLALPGLKVSVTPQSTPEAAMPSDTQLESRKQDPILFQAGELELLPPTLHLCSLGPCKPGFGCQRQRLGRNSPRILQPVPPELGRSSGGVRRRPRLPSSGCAGQVPRVTGARPGRKGLRDLRQLV